MDTTVKGIMAVKAGDTVSILGHEFRTVESITHGWSGNSRNAQRRISIRYTNGDGSRFDSTLVQAEVIR
jgi:hypothetical protein